MYPNYRYAPVHRKDKKEKRPKQKSGDEERSLDIAGLLLQGHTGEDLSKRMSSLDALKKRNGVAAHQQPQAPKEYTFVQGMPNSQGEHAPLPIQAPTPHLAGPGGFSAYSVMHRRSSSAPPADGIFMHHEGSTPTASTSNVSTPLARAFTLAPDSQSPPETAEVPLSRIARNLPRDGKVPKTEGKKIKSTISKSVKAKASGKPGRKRGDDFIQSVWTAHAVADEQRKQQQILQASQVQQSPATPPAPGVQPTWALNDAPPPPSLAPSPAPSAQSFHADYQHPSQQFYGQQIDCFQSGFAPYGQQPQMAPNIFDPHVPAETYGDFGNYGYTGVGSGYIEVSLSNVFDRVCAYPLTYSASHPIPWASFVIPSIRPMSPRRRRATHRSVRTDSNTSKSSHSSSVSAVSTVFRVLGQLQDQIQGAWRWICRCTLTRQWSTHSNLFLRLPSQSRHSRHGTAAPRALALIRPTLTRQPQTKACTRLYPLCTCRACTSIQALCSSRPLSTRTGTRRPPLRS